MLRISGVVCLLGMVLALAPAGCTVPGGKQAAKPLSAAASKPVELPAYIAATVAEHATLSGGGEIPVQGFGLVIGLGMNGSGEVPPQLREYFSQYLTKRKILPRSSDAGELTLRMILSDPDTAVVAVQGWIPRGAKVGKLFDVSVSALSETQTRSLDGGTLLPTDLSFSLAGPTTAKQSKPLAEAEGTIFVNPFLDPNHPGDLVKFRQGRVIGGGRVLEGHSYSLQLHRSDYQLCNLMRNRINERFGGLEQVASATSPTLIRLKVPRSYDDDHERFLHLVMHLPLAQGPGALEAKAMEIASAMSSPGADYEELALVWEAIGKQVLATIKKFYASANQRCAFYSARCGQRLGDPGGTDVLIRLALMDGSPLQVQAIEELGKGPHGIPAVAALGTLLDHDNQLVRIAAYEALVKMGDSTKVQRISIKDQFQLDIVSSSRTPAIYASQTGESKLVLFGRNMEILRPVFYNAPDDLVTIHGAENAESLTVFRRIPRTGRTSELFTVETNVPSLVTTLGTLPVQRVGQKPAGLGLTYGQVVSVLYGMCKQGDIRAEFRLQPLPDVQRIYRDTVTVGRPDMPGS